MTSREKHACFNLIVTCSVIVAFCILLFTSGAFNASIMLIFLSLWGLGPILFLARSRESMSAGVDIHRRATRHGVVFALITAGIACGILWVLPSPTSILYGAVAVIISTWMAFIIAHGVSTLTQHGHHGGVVA